MFYYLKINFNVILEIYILKYIMYPNFAPMMSKALFTNIWF